MLPHLKPKCLKYFSPELSLMVDGAKVLSLLIVFFLCVRKKKVPSLPTWILGVLEGWNCLIVLKNHGDYLQVFALAVSVMGIALLLDVYSDRMKELLTTLMLNFEWLTYANLYTVWKWPDQGAVLDTEYNVPIYFFGPDNWFMYLCIPAVCVAMLYLRTQWNGSRRRLAAVRSAGLVAAAYACVYLQWPATAVVAMAVLAIVLLIGMFPIMSYCVSFPVVLTGGIAANLAIAVFRIMETVPQISNFIKNVLGKDITLTGRSELWVGFWPMIKENIFTGIGIPKEGYVITLPLHGTLTYDHMHNIIFDLLMQGGIPALMLFVMVLLLAGKELTIHARTPSAKILTAAMASLLVMCITEVCRHPAIFLLFPLAYYVGNIERSCTENSEVQNT